MRQIVIDFEDADFGAIEKLAQEQGKSVPDLVRALVSGGLGRLREQMEQVEWGQIERFIKLRLSGLDCAHAAESLQVPEEKAAEWDNRIRTVPSAWQKAFMFARKSTDALSWEMKVMDRFQERWGNQSSPKP